MDCTRASCCPQGEFRLVDAGLFRALATHGIAWHRRDSIHAPPRCLASALALWICARNRSRHRRTDYLVADASALRITRASIGTHRGLDATAFCPLRRASRSRPMASSSGRNPCRSRLALATCRACPSRCTAAVDGIVFDPDSKSQREPAGS